MNREIKALLHDKKFSERVAALCYGEERLVPFPYTSDETQANYKAAAKKFLLEFEKLIDEREL